MNPARNATASPALIGCVILLAGLTVVSSTLLVLQRRAMERLRAEAETRRSVPQNSSEVSRANFVPGRYHWIEDGQEVGVVTLNPDHSLLAANGAGNARFRWHAQREGLVVTWMNSFVLFTEAPAAGHYVGRTDGKRREMIRAE